jgi:hypothetical protein
MLLILGFGSGRERSSGASSTSKSVSTRPTAIAPLPSPTVTPEVPPSARSILARSVQALLKTTSAAYTETYVAEAPGRLQESFVVSGSAARAGPAFEAKVKARVNSLTTPISSISFTRRFRVVGQTAFASDQAVPSWKRTSINLVAVIYNGNLAAKIPLDNPLMFQLTGKYARRGFAPPRSIKLVGSVVFSGSPVWRLRMAFPPTAHRGQAAIEVLVDKTTYIPVFVKLSASGGSRFPSIRMRETILLQTINMPVTIQSPLSPR